ncbi:MAG: ABC transporter substrate-binding protein [Anaerolineae bacterium]|nr:ABC transporter substrate-binding protein [Anaerolineae bacterium]
MKKIHRLSLIGLLAILLVLISSSLSAQDATYGESPMLKERVDAGDLPPVEERLPSNPKVIPVVDEIGQYGGTLHVGDTGERLDEALRMRHTGLFRYNFTASEYQADLAEGWEWSDDYSSLTITLRDGLKWSDGEPFTTDDIAFFWNDVLNNEEISPTGPGGFWTVNGQPTTLEVTDATTFTYHFGGPYPIAMDSFGRTHFSGDNALYGPAHYLKQFHAGYTEGAQALAEEEGFETWVDLFNARRCQCYQPTSMPLDRPYMDSWIPIEIASDRILMERNPYFHQVDSEGNQLPYIDYMEVTRASDQELYALKLTAGEYDFGVRYTRPSDLQLFRQGEEAGNYTTYIARSLQSSAVSIYFNQNYPDPEFNTLFQSQPFRAGLSMAINRDAINDILFFGLGEIHPATPLKTMPWFDDAWYNEYLEYNPDAANAMLDEVGITERDSDDFRLTEGGNRVSIIVQGLEQHMQGCELIATDWRAVGVELICQESSPDLVNQYREENTAMGTAWHLERSTLFGRGTPDNFAVNDGSRHYWAPQWALWISSQGAEGIEPPDEIKALNEKWNEFSQYPSDSPEAAEVGSEYFSYFAEQMPIIPTVGLTPLPLIYTNRLHNVPTEDVFFASDTNFYAPFHMEQWYFAE